MDNSFYIKQMRAFDAYKRAHLKQISMRMECAWLAIFAALNERYWPEGAVVIGRHELLMRFPGSEDTLRRAIAELEAIGLIRVVPETKSSDAAYEMVQLYEEAQQPEQEPEQDARRTSAEPGEICAEFAPDLRGNCGEAAPDGDGCEKVLSLDRARAHARKNVNPNVTPNIYAKEKREEAEEETRARREDTSPALRATSPQGEAGNGQRREEGAAEAATAPGRRETVQNQGDTGGEIWPGNAQPEQDEKRAFAAARACGFSMSKRSREHMAGLCREYGAEWTCEAIDRAALRGADKCNVGYVRAILSRWAAAGGPDAADACAGENVNKHANYTANYGGYTHKNDLCRNYNQRAYTPQDDKALFVDLFADENAL